MNFSAPFILRPIATALLSAGLFLLGAAAYFELPVASLPAVDFPTLRVQASRPGADPETMAATIAAPLERRLGEIAGVTELTSVSSQGSTGISVQFDLTRDIDGAARDVQAALNAAAADLPGDLPDVPTFRKYNPSAAPVLILAMTSKSLPPSAIYDAADTVVAQRISQVSGIARVEVSGAEQPAIRVRVNPTLLASMGLSLEEVRSAIAAANAIEPVGAADGSTHTVTLATNAQLREPEDYGAIVLKTSNGNVVRLSSVASIEHGTRNTRSAAMFDRQPGILLIVRKQPDANVIDAVDQVKALLPNLQRWIPAGIDISVLSDRTATIRASVHDMQITLALAIALVMMVIFLFLRRLTPTVAAGITVPLSLAGTCAVMWLLGFSINNLTLMAFAVAVGFVVDDAIVMIENVYRNLEAGMTPIRATLLGAQQIGFTVLSISVSLIAAFIPVLFMGGVAGRLLREFSVTIVVAIAISVVISLSVTPMICARFLKAETETRQRRIDRIVEGTLGWMVSGYARTLKVALRNQAVTLFSLLCIIVLTAHLYVNTPKGFFPEDDTGLIMGSTEAAADISFVAMAKLQRQALDIILSDPAVEHVGSSVGGSGGPGSGSLNKGRMFISLKPLSERGGMTTARVINRMRGELADINGLEVRMFPTRDIRVGARQGDSSYQFALWDPDLDELNAWAPKILERMKQIPGLVQVSSDRQAGGLQLDVKIDRDAAARLGVRIEDIDNALNNAFSQRQVSTIYAQRNQYRVILEIDPRLQRDPSDLGQIYVPGHDRAQVPLLSVIKLNKGIAPLVVNHQGPFPSATISFDLAPGNTLDAALADIDRAMAEMHAPAGLHGEAAGDARAFAQQASQQPLLILAALIAVYIVLGVLYESLAHPLTIISTLPSAGLGALLALRVAGMELSLTALIGVILLIGIVKKNGIMLVDFALDSERRRGLKPAVAIYEACIARFRPILMTTMAALLGAVPLAIAVGPGSEIRRPLGITIIGGLVVSQLLTLYTTPVIYLLLDRLHRRLGGSAYVEQDVARGAEAQQPAR